jgi:hypothetical protein
LAGFQRNAIEQELIVGNAKNETGIPALGERVLQFLPGGLKLAIGALMVGSIEPRVLDEDVETVEERPRRRAPSGIGLNGGRNNILLNCGASTSAYAGR